METDYNAVCVLFFFLFFQICKTDEWNFRVDDEVIQPQQVTGDSVLHSNVQSDDELTMLGRIIGNNVSCYCSKKRKKKKKVFTALFVDFI